MLDVVIVGAGPAGCAAALRCETNGLQTIVIDKAARGRDKTCGDGLTTNALRQLKRLGITVDSLPTHAAVARAMVIGPDGRTVELPLPASTGYAATVARRELDDACNAALDARSIPCIREDGLESLTRDPNGVTVRTASGFTVRARYVIAADGQYSRVRKLIGSHDPHDLGAWHAVRQYHSNVAATDLWVIFDRALLPGYAWVFPLAGRRANVGFCVPREYKGKDLRALNDHARTLVAPILGPDATPDEQTRAWPIPCAYSPAQLDDGRVLYIGDAANVVDPMTGEGIAQALETGILAADAIRDDGGPRTVARRYRRDVDATLGRDLRFAARLSQVLRDERRATLALRTIDLSGWTRREFARWMFEDYPRALLGTPDRWPGIRRLRAATQA